MAFLYTLTRTVWMRQYRIISYHSEAKKLLYGIPVHIDTNCLNETTSYNIIPFWSQETIIWHSCYTLTRTVWMRQHRIISYHSEAKKLLYGIPVHIDTNCLNETTSYNIIPFWRLYDVVSFRQFVSTCTGMPYNSFLASEWYDIIRCCLIQTVRVNVYRNAI
jgi:hypothetical protein